MKDLLQFSSCQFRKNTGNAEGGLVREDGKGLQRQNEDLPSYKMFKFQTSKSGVADGRHQLGKESIAINKAKRNNGLRNGQSFIARSESWSKQN
jgi:hypothetical protein